MGRKEERDRTKSTDGKHVLQLRLRRGWSGLPLHRGRRERGAAVAGPQQLGSWWEKNSAL